MAEVGIPAEVKQFLSEYISSIEQLEILLLLKETVPRAWTAKELAEKMHISDESIERRLKEFVERKFVKENDARGYYFGPEFEEHNRAINNLSAHYKERRVAVITHIFSNPVDHIQTFADAFRLKPKN